jgi:hypothetical protein
MTNAKTEQMTDKNNSGRNRANPEYPIRTAMTKMSCPVRETKANLAPAEFEIAEARVCPRWTIITPRMSNNTPMEPAWKPAWKPAANKQPYTTAQKSEAHASNREASAGLVVQAKSVDAASAIEVCLIVLAAMNVLVG